MVLLLELLMLITHLMQQVRICIIKCKSPSIAFIIFFLSKLTTVIYSLKWPYFHSAAVL